MRETAVRVLVIVVVGGAMASTSACLPGVGGEGSKAAVCKDVRKEISELKFEAEGKWSHPPTIAEIYSNAGRNIRLAAAKADGDVRAAADEVAAGMDQAANSVRQSPPGTPAMPDGDRLIAAAEQLRDACE